MKRLVGKTPLPEKGHVLALCPKKPIPRLLVCCLVLATWFSQGAAAGPADEYKLKAALVFKLTKFVTWPHTASDASQPTFDICLLGEDDLLPALQLLNDRVVSGRPIRIRSFSNSDAVDRHCRMLFISESKRAFLDEILGRLRGQPILTVGDAGSFASQGGMIELKTGARRIGFQINLAIARRSGLSISAPLLQLATVVQTRKRETKSE